MNTVRLTCGQALARYLAAQRVAIDDELQQMFAGVFAIFGHGNVAGLGEALASLQDALPTYRAHNEQTMAHIAIAFARANKRRRMMAVTSSIGPGATNMVTAAALAHANRLPVLLLPGDTFANRRPDPVLQQIESPNDPNIVVNECFKPVSRYWDRIVRPEQLVTSLPQAMRVLTDPADCGPVTLCLPQDVQVESYDYPESLFRPRTWYRRRQGPDKCELEIAVRALNEARAPLIIAGGGVHYSDAGNMLAELATTHAIPVAETQAGKGALSWSHETVVGAVGVTGTAIANELARQADVVLAVGTRLTDFTTGSRTIFRNPDARIISLNVNAFDAHKHCSLPLVSDALLGLEAIAAELQVDDSTVKARGKRIRAMREEWRATVQSVTRDTSAVPPSDAQILGVLNRAAQDNTTIVCAAGGMPGELHKLWQVKAPGTYHVEYGYSCMGYEIAGAVGVKMARPNDEVYALVGDGSYLMHNSELATSILLGLKIVCIVVDNGGFGCIHRLQKDTTATCFNNLFDKNTRVNGTRPIIDFAAHAASLGCLSRNVNTLAELETALLEARSSDTTTVIAIQSDPSVSTEAGGHWWDVPVATVSDQPAAVGRRKQYEDAASEQKIDG